MTGPAERLAAERTAALERIARQEGDVAAIVAASEGDNADDEHDPEGATIAFERSQAGALAAQARRRLAEVDAALARLADGTYGLCTSCGRPIGDERLEALPATATCIDCARDGRLS